MAMGCRQRLSHSVVQLEDNHCREPQCRNGVVHKVGPSESLHDNWLLSKLVAACNSFALNLHLHI